MFIDLSYFTAGPRHIQNVSVFDNRLPNQDSIAVNEAVMAHIRHWCPRFIKGVLSPEAAKAMNAYIEAKDKHPNLKDAVADSVLEHLREPYANYVFYKILRDANTQATITGLVRLKCANQYVSPLLRQVGAWNEMVDMIKDFREWAKEEGYANLLGNDANFLTKINSFNL